ncbi:unnamed protein product, partial [marine sediment metagenome]
DLIKLGKTKTKRIPRKFLSLSSNQLKILWDGFISGDGCIDKRNNVIVV